MTRPVLIGNSSGFYGDRDAAMREMAEGGPLDVLTGDYLAELTMLILWKARQKDQSLGYARSVLGQLEQVIGSCLDRGIRIVNNAGGLNPAGLAEQITRLAERLGLHPKIAYITGDDLIPRLDDLISAGHSLTHLDTGEPLSAAASRPRCPLELQARPPKPSTRSARPPAASRPSSNSSPRSKAFPPTAPSRRKSSAASKNFDA